MFITSLEEHLLPDHNTLDECFAGDDREEWSERISGTNTNIYY